MLKALIAYIKGYVSFSKQHALAKPALALCISAIVLSIVLFPEVFLKPSISFIWWNDYLVEYHVTFVLASFLYQGGIQLWDFFGQMPHMFPWVTHGMFKLPSILTAFVYWLVSPFSNDSAACFQRVFSFVYPTTLLLIRTVGLFLLLRRLLGRRWILIGGSVVGSVLFCPPAFTFGLLYQSFFPLVMYFVLSFFMTYRSWYLLAAVGLLVACFSQTPIHTCYLYLCLQFFIFACLGWSVCAQPAQARQWLGRLRQSPRRTILTILLSVVVFAIILGPYFYMHAVSLKEYEFGLNQSRISNMFDLDYYFHTLPLDVANHQDMFRRMMDFTFPLGMSFFWGYTIFFLGLVGMVLSADRRKWIFAITLLMVWFINFPRDQISIALIGHWINALANPFKTIARSYHMASYSMIPYLLIPLACLGLESLVNIANGDKKSNAVFKWLGVIGCASLFVVTALPFEPMIVGTYLLGALFMSMTAWTMFMWGRRDVWRRSAWWLIGILIAGDAFLCVYQYKNSFLLSELRQHFFKVNPDIGSVWVDYQNPKILPFVEQFDQYDVMADPVLWSVGGISPSYTRVINGALMFLPPEGHSPRHIAYAQWHRQPWMKEYMAADSRMFSFVGNAVASGPGVLQTVVKRRLTEDLIVVEGQATGLLAQVPSTIAPGARIKERWSQLTHAINEETQNMNVRRDMFIWDFSMPAPLPAGFASTMFTKDHNVRFIIQTADQKTLELEPAQGHLLKPFTFDAQNIKEGKIFVALPLDLRPLAGATGTLFLRQQSTSGITDVWQHDSDRLGFNYNAPGDGWLRVRFPYDPKWQVMVDGQIRHVYKADDSFIGIPLTQGPHKVLIQYWPHSGLRWALLLSAVTATALFFIIMFLALRERMVQTDQTG